MWPTSLGTGNILAKQQGLDFRLLVGPAELAALRAELQELRRIRICPAIAPAAAAALQAELTSSTDWVRTLRQGGIERELSAQTLAGLAPAHLRAIEQLAVQGDDTVFRFLHDAIRISPVSAERQARGWLLDACAEALNAPATLDLIGALAGEEVRSFRGDATRYLPGHFLTTHNDGRKHGKRVLAVVLNLSQWHLDWGGLMLFHNAYGAAHCAWTPAFNTLNLFSVPQDHSVTMVTPLARAPRLTVSGWFYAD